MSADGTAQTDTYSGDGLRTVKQTGGTATYFLYDGSEPVCEYTASGTSLALLAVNIFGETGLIARHTSTSIFYTFDERGNVAQRTGSTGLVVSSDLYDAYGARSSTGGADVFGYGGQAGYYTDAETGLVLCTHRYFDPSTGRCLTRDPLRYMGGINLYGYTTNNPINHEDEIGFGLLGGIGSAAFACAAAYAQGFYLADADTNQDRSCNAISACASGIIAGLFGLLGGLINPLAGGCIGGFAGGIANTIGSIICNRKHDERCGTHTPVDWECQVIGLVVSTALGCVGGGVANSENPPIAVTKDGLENYLISNISTFVGYDASALCAGR